MCSEIKNNGIDMSIQKFTIHIIDNKNVVDKMDIICICPEQKQQNDPDALVKHFISR
jgi:hypothetical protein